jgi:hypothetical protein
MRRVCHGITGDPLDLCADGVTHLYLSNEETREALAFVYLCCPALSVEVVAHELHHATLGIYGAFVDPETPVPEVLTNANEELAHMFSEALVSTLETLAQSGYEIDGYRPWWVAAP